MAIDSRFVSISDLQGLFRDKDTGLPLAAGKLYFFKDNARTVPKDIYILSGTPPNYTFTNIGSEMTLSSIGTYQYLGNDVIPFYFPYDGTPEESNGDIELYFVEVENSDEVPQFTREAVPYISDEGTSETDFTNYIPNGQFLAHNNLPQTFTGSPLYQAGQIRDTVTEIAQGGWYFVRSNNDSEDFVIFERIADIEQNPTANPRYFANIKCESAASNNEKDLRIRFSNVNKFASDTQRYTFALTGMTNAGSDITVGIYLIKNFGTSGSSSTETFKGNLTFSNAFSIRQLDFIFGLNDDESLGTIDDDYVEIAVRFPTNAEFDASVTDAILTPNIVNVESFPQTPDSEFKYQGIAGFMPTPDPDGNDLGLSLILTKEGLRFDDSVIGNVYPSSFINDSVYYLPASGGQYETAGYSTIGIPYRRLQSKYFDETLNLPVYGTGDEFLTCYLSDLTPATQMRISTNKIGAVTNASNGTLSPGFAPPATIHTGADYKEYAYKYAADSIDVFGTIIGAMTATAVDVDTGFTIINYQDNGDQYSRFTITTIAATTLAGKYFNFNNTTTPYYMWFTVNGAGSNPAPGGRTEIRVDLLSTYTAEEVASCVKEALNGNQITTIIATAASTIPTGSYFNINTTSTEYYVWYQKDGAGTDPAPGGKVGIKVDILDADTATQVAFKTQTAINSKYFKVPNYNNGLFIRGFKEGDHWDKDSRFSEVTTIYGDMLPTMQYGQYQYHLHGTSAAELEISPGLATGADRDLIDVGTTTNAAGGFETRPINSTVYFVIKY